VTSAARMSILHRPQRTAHPPPHVFEDSTHRSYPIGYEAIALAVAEIQFASARENFSLTVRRFKREATHTVVVLVQLFCERTYPRNQSAFVATLDRHLDCFASRQI
jgi:hypothetical protein